MADPVTNTAKTGFGVAGRLLGAFAKVSPLLLLSATVAAATGDLTLTAEAVTQAGDAVAAAASGGEIAVDIGAGDVAEMVWNGLTENVSNLMSWVADTAPGAAESLSNALN